MAGHSKWAKIHRGKAIEDAKRGAIFTKLGNAIAIAAKNGTDPNMNFALRLAIDKAKAANMPSSNIQRAIDRGSGKLGGEQIQEVMYEGYGPAGVAILVECATDNINRTYPDVKSAFSKHGGSIAEKGSVLFQFNRKGMIRIEESDDIDEILIQVLDAGAEDIESSDGESVIITSPKDLARIRDRLKETGLKIIGAELTFMPANMVEITDKDTAFKIIRLMDALEDLDDVSATHTNFSIADNLIID